MKIKQDFNKLAEPLPIWTVAFWLIMALTGYVAGFWLRATGQPLAAMGAYVVMMLGMVLTLREIYYFCWRIYVCLVNPPPKG